MSAQNQNAESREFRDQALSEVVVDRGTPYQITDQELKDLRVFSPNHSSHFVTVMQSTKEHNEHNDLGREPTSKEVAAIARLHAALGVELEKWRPDIAIKAFYDLDTVFFDGHLRGSVCVGWSDGRVNHSHPPMPRYPRDPESLNDVHARVTSGPLKVFDRVAASGQIEAIIGANGLASQAGYSRGQCRIFLNTETILSQGKSGSVGSWGQMWLTLLHEMCHAYDRVRTTEEVRHGKHFGTKLEAVKKRWNKLFGMHKFRFALNLGDYDRFDPSELSGCAGEVVSGTE